MLKLRRFEKKRRRERFVTRPIDRYSPRLSTIRELYIIAYRLQTREKTI